MSDFKFKVQKDVPIPSPSGQKPRVISEELQILVDNMRIGECIDVPTLKISASIASRLDRNGAKSSDGNYFKSVVRKLKNENNVNFWRIWKVRK